MLFQRRTSRRSGFIRKKQSHEMSLIGQFRTERQIYQNDATEFSPFKDFSPEPIDKILQTYRHFQPNYSHNNNNKKVKFVLPPEHKQISKEIQKKYENQYQYENIKKQQNIKNQQNKKVKESSKPLKQKPVVMEIEKQKNELYPDYSAFFQSRTKKVDNNFSFLNKTSSPQMNFISSIQTQQQVHQISIKPTQLTLTLAESFSLNCKRLKEKFQDERRRFSRSRLHRTSRTDDQASKMLKKEFRQRSRVRQRKQSNKQNKNTGNLSRRNTENKQNQSYSETYRHDTSINTNIENKPPINKKRSNSFIEKKKPSELETSKLSFFVPVTQRERSITPKQARQHSYKKWKQLPQVVAKEKVKQKQKHMRQRLIKMRAHSEGVRKMIRK